MIAAMLAVDPAGLGGVGLHSRGGPERDQWLARLRQLLPAGLPMRRIPLHADDGRLLGALDLAATLRTGRPITQRGLLAETDGGLAILASAERLSATSAARLTQVLDTGEAVLERNGLSLRSPARLGLVALDESASEGEHLQPALLDRLAFHLQFDASTAGDNSMRVVNDSASPRDNWDQDAVEAARLLLPRVIASDAVVQALCATAHALGIGSLRAPMLALRVARVAAALDGRAQVDTNDSSLAASLVLAPRATRWPDAAPEQKAPSSEPVENQSTPPEAPPGQQGEPDETASSTEPGAQELADRVLQAVQAAIPAGLLASLRIGQGKPTRAPSGSGSGAQQSGKARGRPIGARRGELGAGARLNVLQTLRAAAPWQTLRQRDAAQRIAPRPDRGPDTTRPRIQVRREDFHVTRFKQRRETTTIFAVDASGSAALHRLAEAKGAVELLLADCYVRRDRVAVLAFRGKGAELLLPPTRSLVRAKRSLAGLPGGGGTPLAAGVDAALELALACGRRGETPVMVLLTDGRANIARDGSPGRERAHLDALTAARAVRAANLTALLLDTSPQPQAQAQRLAHEMGATYLPLPHAGATQLSQAVRIASVMPASLRARGQG